jgi:hypothetical protein
MLGRFNRKAHSKDLESLQPVDASAPSLKSITRSPSPSLSAPFNSTTNSTIFNRSQTSTSINSLTGCNSTMSTSASVDSSPTLFNEQSSKAKHTNSASNLSNLIEQESAATEKNKIVLNSSLASLNLQDQQFVGEHVLKIYKNDQYFKFLVVHKVIDCFQRKLWIPEIPTRPEKNIPIRIQSVLISRVSV